ncbi:hypothetical protein T459_07756 [Capsicum annuum]|uniref:Uncharacterized protein n=1 Tax=Capsicum annuum TaxID=4072 RepID=A0A2G2ZUI8_CAPAN|nr:hypothetical protein T459_07756 [Capsicum annuum]
MAAKSPVACKRKSLNCRPSWDLPGQDTGWIVFSAPFVSLLISVRVVSGKVESKRGSTQSEHKSHPQRPLDEKAKEMKDKDPEKVVFHIVTASLNLPAMSMWFVMNPPGKATIQIQSIDSFDWLSTKYNEHQQKQNGLDPRRIMGILKMRILVMLLIILMVSIVNGDENESFKKKSTVAKMVKGVKMCV